MELHTETPAAEPLPSFVLLDPPPPILDPGARRGSDGRLAAVLRAQVGQPPAVLLAHAASRFLRGDDDLARAFADLAVTGAAAVARYDATPPTVADVEAAGRTWGEQLGLIPIERARRRAEDVRAYLPLSAIERAATPALGWIAVSGEDDPPWRPVNARATRFPQRDVALTVDGVALRVRYAQTGPLRGRRVIVLAHGHSSRLEEYEDLMVALDAIRGPSGLREYTVLALDLPGCGYSTFVEPAAPPAGAAPAVAFTARAVAAFVEAVFAAAGLAPDVAAIGGGSLGGNLALLFGEHRPAWLQAIAPWSPAGLWAWDLGVELVRSTVGGRALIDETTASRADYFTAVYERETPPGWLDVVGQPFVEYVDANQSTRWYGASWPAAAAALRASRRDRYEVYHPTFRRWHWQLAYEQLAQLHPASALQQIDCPVVILAGSEDDHANAHIFSRVRDAIAGPLSTRPGAGYLLTGVGHSIHNERPAFLAAALDRFLRTHTRRSKMPTDIQLDSDKVLVSSTYLEVAASGDVALELDGEAARQRAGARVGGDRRRALVHADGDQLMINYDDGAGGDYSGGVVMNGGQGAITITAPTVEVRSSAAVNLSGPAVAVARGTRFTIGYRDRVQSEGPRAPRVAMVDVELDVLQELLALRREVNELRKKVSP